MRGVTASTRCGNPSFFSLCNLLAKRNFAGGEQLVKKYFESRGGDLKVAARCRRSPGAAPVQVFTPPKAITAVFREANALVCAFGLLTLIS